MRKLWSKYQGLQNGQNRNPRRTRVQLPLQARYAMCKLEPAMRHVFTWKQIIEALSNQTQTFHVQGTLRTIYTRPPQRERSSNSFVSRALCLGLGVQSRSTRREVDLGKRRKQEEAGGPLVGRPRPLWSADQAPSRGRSRSSFDIFFVSSTSTIVLQFQDVSRVTPCSSYDTMIKP